MRKILCSTAMLIWLTGCSTLHTKDAPPIYRPSQGSQLSSAIAMLQKGKEDEAVRLLTAISAEKRGTVTDEALFRLGLIYLGNGHEKYGIIEAQKILERLQKEHPKSLWSIQASGLVKLIVKARSAFENNMELRRQIKDLRDLNLSLMKENEKLRLNIEQLKTLDLELEQRIGP